MNNATYENIVARITLSIQYEYSRGVFHRSIRQEYSTGVFHRSIQEEESVPEDWSLAMRYCTSCVGLKVTCAVEGTALVPIPRRSIDFVNLTDLRGAGLRFLVERLRVSERYQYVSI